MDTKLLARHLRQYYTRRGNKVVFTNGMTLNRLAMEMWERLGYRSVDASVISRVLKGERIFNFRQLAIFTQLLGINDQQKLILKRVLFEEMSRRYGLEDDFFRFRNSRLVDSGRFYLQRGTEMKAGGDPLKSVELYEEICNHLREEIPFVSSAKDRNEMRKILANTLIEEQEAIGLVYSTKVSRPIMSSLISELIETAKSLRDTELLSKAYFCYGDMLYINDDHENAIGWFLDATKLIGEDKGVFDYRPLTTSFAHLNDKVGFKNSKSKLLKNIQRQPLGQQCVSFCGLTKVSSYLNDRKSTEKYLFQAKSILPKIHDKPNERPIQRRLQVDWSELYVAQTLKSGKNYYSRISNDSLALAKERGYTRYEDLISLASNKALN